jgi:DNA-binding transcriptional MerR regulator
VTQADDNGAQDPAEDGALLTTGEMARRSNNTLRTVRFYEEEGILRPVRRTDGGHRLFDRRELERLLLVSDMRAAGLSLDEIKQILEIKTHAANGGDAARRAKEVLTKRIAELREKLAVLQRLEEDLTETTALIADCMDCSYTHAPGRCDACSVMASHPSVPRSLRVLWQTQCGRANGTET